MISSRSSTPMARAAVENSTPKTISPGGSDSGYASTANATEGSMTDHSQDCIEGIALPRKIFARKVTKLRLFDREIPQLTQHRFHDLYEMFGVPLCDHLVQARIDPYPISLKLKVLGESEATAKPWILVLCTKTASKRVQHFFKQRHIKAYYQPSHPDPFLPYFGFLVRTLPPRPMAGTVIYGDHDERVTMCGTIIKLGEAHQSRCATIGGVIRYVFPKPILYPLDRIPSLEACLGGPCSQNMFHHLLLFF